MLLQVRIKLTIGIFVLVTIQLIKVNLSNLWRVFITQINILHTYSMFSKDFKLFID